jgi:hypothetical protein
MTKALDDIDKYRLLIVFVRYNWGGGSKEHANGYPLGLLQISAQSDGNRPPIMEIRIFAAKGT